jgi:ABC-type Na+ efflux pump permease subunit
MMHPIASVAVAIMFGLTALAAFLLRRVFAVGPATSWVGGSFLMIVFVFIALTHSKPPLNPSFTKINAVPHRMP